MKKIFLALLLCITLLSLSLLTSCEFLPTGWLDSGAPEEPSEEPEGNDPITPPAPLKLPTSAEELQERINAAVSESKSYSTHLLMNMVLYSGGIKFDVEAEGNTVFSSDLNGDSFYLSKTRESVKAPSQNYNEILQSLNAYYDGKAFLKNKGGAIQQTFWCEMSAEEYEEYYFKENAVTATDPDFAECISRDFKLLDNGGWELNYSGYTAAAISKFEKMMKLNELDSDQKIEDISVSITAGVDFLPEKLTISVTFEDDTVKPELELVCEFSDYNNVFIDTRELDTDDYLRVDDVFLLSKIADMLEARENADDGYFMLDLDTELLIAGQKSTSAQAYAVEYGTDEDGYYYNIDISGTSGSGSLTFKGGILSDGTQSTNQTHGEARETVNSLMNTAIYTEYLPNNIAKLEDGRYRLDCGELVNDSYFQIAVQLGMRYESASQSIYVTIADGEIMKIESTVIIKAKYSPSWDTTLQATITIDSVVDFTATPNGSVETVA